MIQQGIDVILYLNGSAVGGQQGAVLERSMAPIDITNKINGEWEEHLSGLKNWNVKCNGVYLISLDAFNELDDAFMNNEEINVELRLKNKSYIGKGLIIDFPVNSVYSQQFKYTINILGIGELKSGDNTL